MGDLLEALAIDGRIAYVIDGLPVLGTAADQAGHRADDGGTHQHEAQDLLHHGGRSQAPHVQGEQEQGADGADDDGHQVDIRVGDVVQGIAGLDVGDQIPQHVGDLNGLPGDDGHEGAKGSPAGDEGDLLVKCPVGKGHAAAGHGEHGDQFAVAQGNGDHHDQSHNVADGSGDGAAAAGHPAVDGHSPAHADDGAKADAEKVYCTDALLFCLIAHTVSTSFLNILCSLPRFPLEKPGSFAGNAS